MTNRLPDLNTASNLFKRWEFQKGIALFYPKYWHRFHLDFDVYLPTKGRNLQRGDVWTLEQKESLIESLLVQRYIPPISVILSENDQYQVIDGKQRLTALIQYLNGEFPFCGYYYSELPKDYKQRIDYTHILGDRLLEYPHDLIPDEVKIEWFKWINFAGTPQERDYLASFD